MRFSPLSRLLTIQISTWCVLGAWVHGWQLLCYPAAWLVIGAAFYGLHVAHDRQLAAASSRKVKPLLPTHETRLPERHRRFEASQDAVTVG